MSEPTKSSPELSGIVVQWGDPAPLRALVEAWPRDPRFELVVVDNGGGLPELPPWVRLLSPGRNLGFGGGANAGAALACGRILLVLNPDVVPRPGALERLVEGFERYLDAAGLAPRLEGPDGRGQHGWQLRKLPSPATLLLHALFVPAGEGAATEPPPGAPVEQPAAAALALRREAFETVGGFDAGFFPAWFEDVDLAGRLRAGGRLLRYHPEAVFRHALGGSVASLGYGAFLWIYGRNLVRYLARHHGRGWAVAARLLLPAAALARLVLLPLRRPKRAASRRDAAVGLVAAAAGAVSGWRLPAGWAARFRPVEGPP